MVRVYAVNRVLWGRFSSGKFDCNSVHQEVHVPKLAWVSAREHAGCPGLTNVFSPVTGVETFASGVVTPLDHSFPGVIQMVLAVDAEFGEVFVGLSATEVNRDLGWI